MRNLWEQWLPISRELEQATHWLLLFDFDGTLAPIIERPQDVKILPRAQQALRWLAGHSRCTVGFVSGRSLADLKRCVRVPRSFYAGNYGLEWEGPGVGRFRAPLGSEVQAGLRQVKKLVSSRLGQVPGVWVEDKGLSLSIHYRRVAPQRIRGVRDRLARLPANFDHLLEWHPGKMIFEVRPAGGPDKAEIVHTIADTVERRRGVAPLLFYFGDDVGDEPAFAVVSQRGYAVRVGKPMLTSHAPFYLTAPGEVAEFLQRVWSYLALERPTQRPPGKAGVAQARRGEDKLWRTRFASTPNRT